MPVRSRGSRVFIVGAPASGKTTVGYELAKLLAVPFIDLDKYIEQQSGCSIPEIFAREHESGFRRLETNALRKIFMEATDGSIIATGGGIVLAEENRELLLSAGAPVVFLDANDALLAQRIAKNPASRPLFHDQDTNDVLSGIMRQRRQLYQQVATYTVQVTSEISAADLARNIYQHLSANA